MENSAFAFGPPYAALYGREPDITGEDGFLDPSLLYADPSVSSPSAGMWEPPQPVQRFLQDPQKTAFFNAGLAPSRALPARPAHGAPPAPPESHVAHRFASPVSLSENRSSVSAGDDVFLPDTPPDTALLSPFTQPMQYESPATHALRFMGPAPPAHAYGHLADVNPLLQNPDWNDMDAGSLSGFTPAHQHYTLSGYTPMTGPSDFELTPRVPLSGDGGGGGSGGDDDDHDHDNNDIQQPMTKEDPPELATSTPEPATVDADDRDGEPRRDGQPKKTAASTPPKKRAKTGSSQQEAAPLACDQCNAAPFRDAAALDRHVKKQHTRPFHCVFGFAGCGYTFATKNEWKRHTTTQHLVPEYWLCTEGNCAVMGNGGVGTAGPGWDAETKPRKRSRDHAAYEDPFADHDHDHDHDEAVRGPWNLPNGKIFNRKDLYTAHLRRMHVPAHAKTAKPARKTAGGKNTGLAGCDERVNMLQERARTKRCALPTHMECPAATCRTVFDGPDAWDQRMEHVAHHLESDVAVPFGAPADTSLTAWAAAPGVAIIRKTEGGRWVLNDPLKRGVGLHVVDDDDDDDDDGHATDPAGIFFVHDVDAPGDEVLSFDDARGPL